MDRRTLAALLEAVCAFRCIARVEQTSVLRARAGVADRKSEVRDKAPTAMLVRYLSTRIEWCGQFVLQALIAVLAISGGKV